MSESKLVAQVIIDNGDSIAVTNATRDAMVDAMAATERANKKIEDSEEAVSRALKTRISVSKEVDLAIRAQAAAGKPLEQELVQLAGVYARLEAAMRQAAKSGGGVPAGLASEAARVRTRMAAVEGQIAQSAARGGASLSALGTSAMASLGALSALGAGALTVGAAVRGFGDFMTDAIAEAAEAEAGVVRLSRALESQGRNTDQARKKIVDYAGEMSRATAFSDDEVLSIQTKLLMLGHLSDDALPAATRATLDLVASGESQEAAVDALSKAYNGNFKSLGQMLPAIRDGVKEAGSFEEVLKLVNAQVGGQAAAQLDTYEGKVKALGNSWKEVKEIVGTELLPVLTDVVDGLRISSNFILSAGGGEETIFKKAMLDAVPLLGELRKFAVFREEMNKNFNVAQLEEREKAWKDAQAKLGSMQDGSASGTLENLGEIETQLKAQEAEVDRLYDSYVKLFMLQEERGVGIFKGGNKPMDDGAAAAAAAEAAAKEEEKRRRAAIALTLQELAIQDDLERAIVHQKNARATLASSIVEEGAKTGEPDPARVAELQAIDATIAGLELEKAARAEADEAAKRRHVEMLKELTTTDELEQKIVTQQHARDALAASILKEGNGLVDLNRERVEEIKKIDDAIAKLEEEKRVRKEAADKEVADKKKAAAETLRLIEQEQQARLQLAQTVGSAMGTALGETVAGEKRAGQAVRQVARETALAAINAAAAIAAARQMAAHAYIPFVGIAIGGAFAAAIVTAIFANKRFLAMAAGGEPRGFGTPGMDSVPVMMRPDENVVDHTTNNRTKRMLDAFERGEFTGGRAPSLELHIHQSNSSIPDSDFEYDRKTRQMIGSIQRALEMGELMVPSSAVR